MVEIHKEDLNMESNGDTSLPVDTEHSTTESIAVLEPSYSKNKLFAANTYAAKKTVAQGMMDIALLTANANQLRYILEYGRDAPTFEVNVALIVISLILQMAVGVSLIFKGRADLSAEDKRAYSNRLNNYVVVGVFIVTVINVFVAAFSIPAAHHPALLNTAAAAAVSAPIPAAQANLNQELK